jgi:hypothetical protein
MEVRVQRLSQSLTAILPFAGKIFINSFYFLCCWYISLCAYFRTEKGIFPYTMQPKKKKHQCPDLVRPDRPGQEHLYYFLY